MTATLTTKSSRWGLVALTATHAGNDFYTGAVAALLPFFVLNAGYTYAQIAGITLAATALSSVAQPFFGYLTDRFALRWLSLAGLLAAGVGIAATGLVAHSYAAVCVAVAVSGLGVAAYHPAATVEAREAGGGTARAMSLFSVGGNVGVALAPTAVILVVGALGLPGTWMLAAPALVLGLLYVLAVRRRSVAPAPSAPVVGAPAPAPAVAATNDWRSFLWLSTVLAAWSIAYVGTSTFVSLYSIARFHVDTATASIALTVFPAAGAVGTLAGGWLSDRFGRLRMLRVGYLGGAVAVLAIVAAPSAAAVVVATAALGVCLFLPFAAQITLSHTYLPGRIGVASGVTLGLTLSLGGLVSPLLGAVADADGPRTVFVIMAGLLAAGAVLSWILREGPRRR